MNTQPEPLDAEDGDFVELATTNENIISSFNVFNHSIDPNDRYYYHIASPAALDSRYFKIRELDEAIEGEFTEIEE